MAIPMNPEPPENLQAFYENEYHKRRKLSAPPRNDDFTYGQVLSVLRPYLRPGLTALDLGCSNGKLSLYMAKAGCDVLGVDLARNAVELATQSAAAHHLSNATFQAMDFVRDWQQPDAFDLIFSSFVLEHIPDDREFIDKIAYALKPGGQLLLLTATTYSLPALVSRVIRSSAIFYLDEDVGHVHRYNRGSLGKLLANAGLTVTRTGYLDSALRDWTIQCKPMLPLRVVWSRPYIRSAFNALDALLARILFPGTIYVSATK